MMKIIFLQNSATQPRCHKRYRTFIKTGSIDAEVYSFNRNWYNVNLPEDIKINSLGDLQPGSYFRRLFLYIKKLRPVFKKHKDAIFYCYGQDMAFVAMLFRRKFVYEESDIMYLEYKKPFLRNMMKKLDLYIQKKSIASVFTSQGFVEYLYGDKVPPKVFVLPNKLDRYFIEQKRPNPKSCDVNSLKFAFIGLLRYEKTLFPFIEAMIKDSPKHEFHIWGDGGEALKNRIIDFCKTRPQVTYHGPFRNPYDLESIYAKIDINFVCYDTTGGNERIAEPNKLYESIFFNTPMLVSPDTYLAKVVHNKGNGFVVDCKSKEGLESFFQSLSPATIEDKVKACRQINKEDIIDSIQDIVTIKDYIISQTCEK